MKLHHFLNTFFVQKSTNLFMFFIVKFIYIEFDIKHKNLYIELYKPEKSYFFEFKK